jgi:hypothetical protein
MTTDELTIPATQRETAAQSALAETQQRLQELACRLADAERQRGALAQREHAAQERAANLRTIANGAPERIHATRARVLVLAGSPAEGAAQAALKDAERAGLAIVQEAQAAEAERDVALAQLASERADLDAQTAAWQSERDELSALVVHLQREVTEAKQAQGEQLLAIALRETEAAGWPIMHATWDLERAQQHREEVRQEQLHRLQPYPAALAQIRGTLLEEPAAPTPTEAVLTAWIAYLDALAAGAGRVAASAAGTPLWVVLTGVDQLPHVISGQNAAWPVGKRAQAAAWLNEYRRSRPASAQTAPGTAQAEDGVVYGVRVPD